jgi:hypothetical protein
MNSIVQTVAGKSEQPYPEWANQARKDRLPTSMEEYFQSWGMSAKAAAKLFFIA